MTSENPPGYDETVQSVLREYYLCNNEDRKLQLENRYRALTGTLPPQKEGNGSSKVRNSPNSTPDYYPGDTRAQRKYNQAVHPDDIRNAAQQIADDEYRRQGGF